MQQNPGEDGMKKMDILFYNSYRKARRFYVFRCVYHLLKLLLLVIFLPIDIHVLNSTRTFIIVWLAISIGVCLFNLLVSMAFVIAGYGNSPRNNTLILNLAMSYEHSVPAQPIRDHHDLEELTRCVSQKMYNQTNQTEIDNEGLTEDLKDRYQGMYTNIIQSSILQLSSCLSFLEGLAKFASFGIIVTGIVALATSKPSAAELGVGIVFLVLEAWNVWMVILFFIALALSPIICCVACIWCCFFANRAGRQNLNLVASPATAQMIQQTDGSCSICFQNFNIREQVYVLPCSKKHMFHEGCLNNWLNASQSCPICRYRLDGSQQQH